MFIREKFENKKPVLSFEIFPFKTDSKRRIYNTLESLASLNPDYVSITYGAGGSQKENKTIEIASLIQNEFDIESMVHLTAITSKVKDIDEFLKKAQDSNIRNILALRGDIPRGIDIDVMKNRDFKYSSDLTRYIKETEKFGVAGACYPEGHVRGGSIRNEILNLKKKVDSGSDFLISQLFLDNDIFYNYREMLKESDICVPVEAGILAVTNKRQIKTIESLSSAGIPEKFKRIVERYADKDEALEDAGIAYATEQIIDLLSSGVDGVHLYTMNNPRITKKITDNLSSVLKALGR